jgi:hypothetical protein
MDARKTNRALIDAPESSPNRCDQADDPGARDPRESGRVQRLRGPDAPGLTGTIVRQHIAKLIRTLGRGTVEEAIDHLRPDDAETIRQVSHLGWVAVEAFEELYEVLALRSNRDVAALHWEIGRQCTLETFRTLWRMLLRVTSDEALVARTPVIYSKSYNKGKLEAVITGPGEARLLLTDWPGTPLFVRRGLCIGITAVLEIAGRQGVRVNEEATATGAAFHVKWTV